MTSVHSKKHFEMGRENFENAYLMMPMLSLTRSILPNILQMKFKVKHILILEMIM